MLQDVERLKCKVTFDHLPVFGKFIINPFALRFALEIQFDPQEVSRAMQDPYNPFIACWDSPYSPGRRIQLRCQSSKTMGSSDLNANLDPIHHHQHQSSLLDSSRPASGRDSSSSSATLIDEDEYVDFVIEHVYLPFTMSVVCRVRRIGRGRGRGRGRGPNQIPRRCILKLYDRRHIYNLRETYDKARPHDQSKEEAYVQYHARKSSSSSSSHDSVLTDDSDEDDEGSLEDFIQHELEKTWFQEVSAYHTFSPLQGRCIPRLYSLVRHGSVQGLLLEYIRGGTLREYITRQLQPSLPLQPVDKLSLSSSQPSIDQEEVKDVCNEAVDLVNEASRYGILNDDVRLDNILVRPRGGESISLPQQHLSIDMTPCAKLDRNPHGITWRAKVRILL